MKKRGNTRLLAVFLCALLAAALSACGAAEETRPATAGAGWSTVVAAGINNCATCHTVQTGEWLQTPHANLNPANPTNLSYAGYPNDASITPPACTKQCHDPDLNNDTLTTADNDSRHLTAGMTGDGVVFRPVVGCEACHGNGSNHNGWGPIGPYWKTESQINAAPLSTVTTIDVNATKTASFPTLNVGVVTTGPATLGVTATSTFTRAAGSFVTDGFAAGMTVTTSGFANAPNNGTFMIASVTATTLRITTSSLVTEVGSGDELIKDTAPPAFTRADVGSFSTDGFLAGNIITTSGFTNAANNGMFTVASVAAKILKVTATTLVTETGTGDELITASDAFTRTTGDFTADGFLPGRVIRTSGFTSSQNNASFVVTGVTPTTITVAEAKLVVEPGTGDERIESTATMASAQFNTCTECHELLDLAASDPINAASPALAAHDTPAEGGINSPAARITDTHYAKPGVFTGAQGANTVDINGYAMDYSGATVCSVCHSPHRNIDINREWAQSAHADKTAVGAWAHYNWSSRPTCQRCKSATGFSAYADALRTNNAASAAAIRDGSAPPQAANTAYKPEMLHCNGCHTDNKGSLRNPGRITGYYDVVISNSTRSTYSYQFPDIKESNICMACHTGRETGESIKLLNNQGLPVVDFGNLGFGNVNSHYLTAGATVFRVSGYEYPNRNYNDLTGYRHKSIGTTAEPGTGSRGPCIGCHMSRPAGNGDHLFLPVSKDATGVVTGIASEVCMVCHGPSPTVIFDLVSHQESLYAEALEALKAQLAFANAYHGAYTWQVNYPYFTATNWLSTGDTDVSGNTTGKHTIGAAFNFNLLEHEGGGYTHNRIYVKRLIYDSIDWLDDNQMNYSVGATLDAAPHSGALWQAEAKEYLLPNGKLGIAAERP